jgi:DNA-directed RNA polymerase subunit RPC12/RpoP
MKITIWKCDRCGKEFREGRGRTVEITDSIDLCFMCTENIMEQFVRAMDFPKRKALLEEIRSRLPN